MFKQLWSKLFTLALLVGLLLPGSRPEALRAAPTAYDCTTATGLPQAECEALVALYNATGGDAWNIKTDWLATTTPCTWHGVTCVAGRVTWLTLAGNNLRGLLPPEIGNLSALKYLDLDHNALTVLPPEIDNLVALQVLHLGDNALAVLPPEIGNLPALIWLWLVHNPLSGEMPAFLTSLTQLQGFAFYATGWCVPATGVVPAWLAGVGEVYGTGLLCGQAPGHMGGFVTLPGTIPAAGTQVNLYQWTGDGEYDSITTTYTLPDGTYQFDSLGQGIGYRVGFVDLTGHYVSEYYDNQLTVEQATPVTVTLGMTRTGIDAELTPVAPYIIKSATPALTITNGSLLTYTLGIYANGGTLHLYDPLTSHMAWQGFVGDAPNTLTYADGALTGTVALAALTPLTVSFAVRVSLPAASFVGEYAQVSNTAYAYVGETPMLGYPSNMVIHTVHELPFALFLPLVLRGE